jgi:hypothetical protein
MLKNKLTVKFCTLASALVAGMALAQVSVPAHVNANNAGRVNHQPLPGTPQAYIPIAAGPQPTSTPSPMPTLTPTPTLTPPPNDSVFGIEMYNIMVGGNEVAQAGTTWVRRNGLIWSDIEPTEGVLDWSAAAGLEAELVAASRLGLKIILVVRSTPAWAQMYPPDNRCGPIREDKMEAFGRFVGEAVARYSVPPYNIKYWEIWNEPDSGGVDLDPPRPYGCWGNSYDPYYNGRLFAKAMIAAYPQVKAADPESQVLLGGLLMNCDPDKGTNCKQSKFLEGVLIAGGGPYFDGVSYHTYDYYLGSLGRYGTSGWNSAWNTTGPLLITKGRFIKEVLAARGVTGKFLVDTELGLLCSNCRNDANYETTKAYYIAQAYAASMAEGLLATTWYSLQGWLGTELVDAQMNPKPAFVAFRVSRDKIGGAEYVGKLTSADVGGVTGITGYKFEHPGDGKRVWLMWSLGGSTRTARFTDMPTAITDPLGEGVTPATTLQVGIKPVFVEWNMP